MAIMLDTNVVSELIREDMGIEIVNPWTGA